MRQKTSSGYMRRNVRSIPAGRTSPRTSGKVRSVAPQARVTRTAIQTMLVGERLLETEQHRRPRGGGPTIGAMSATETISFDDFLKVDVRVGRIVDVQP